MGRGLARSSVLVAAALLAVRAAGEDDPVAALRDTLVVRAGLNQCGAARDCDRLRALADALERVSDGGGLVGSRTDATTLRGMEDLLRTAYTDRNDEVHALAAEVLESVAAAHETNVRDRLPAAEATLAGLPCALDLRRGALTRARAARRRVDLLLDRIAAHSGLASRLGAAYDAYEAMRVLQTRLDALPPQATTGSSFAARLVLRARPVPTPYVAATVPFADPIAVTVSGDTVYVAMQLRDAEDPGARRVDVRFAFSGTGRRRHVVAASAALLTREGTGERGDATAAVQVDWTCPGRMTGRFRLRAAPEGTEVVLRGGRFSLALP